MALQQNAPIQSFKDHKNSGEVTDETLSPGLSPD
jgi:hypothetical protein